MIFGAHACGIPTCLGVVIVKEMGVCFSIPFITFLLALIIYYVCTLMCLFTSTFNISSFLLIKKNVEPLYIHLYPFISGFSKLKQDF